MSINISRVGGRLTCDPKSTTLPNGKILTEFSLAMNRSYSGDDNSRREETTFIDVICWARLAEVSAEFCRKGSAVLVTGRLQLDQWEEKEIGAKRSKLRTVAESIEFLDRKPAEAGKEEIPAAPTRNTGKERGTRREKAAAI